MRNIMPCGCVCCTCLGCGEGVVAAYAKEMLTYLNGYDDFLAGHPDQRIVADTMRVLHFWSTQNCSGCRGEDENQCQNGNCPVRDCSKEHKVDFCYTCKNYPCEVINGNKKWREANDDMLHNGPAAFFENESKKSHYRHYKK